MTGAEGTVVEPWQATLTPTLERQIGALWGKSNAGGTKEAPRPNLLLQHLFDSSAVGELLWDRYLAPGLRGRIDGFARGDGRRFLAWLCGLHDVGKATPAFQGQAAELSGHVEAAGLVLKDVRRSAARAWRHELAGALAVRDILADRWSDPVGHSDWVWPLIAGHHGKVPRVGQLKPSPRRGRRSPHAPDEHWSEVQEQLVELVTLATGYPDLPACEPSGWPSRADQLLLSGLVIMADWIASDQEHIQGISHLDGVSVAGARTRAETAWRALGLRGGWGRLPSPSPNLISRRFGFAARPFQDTVVEAAERMPSPGVLVVEAPMGEGKTEAALAAAEVLAARFGADGVFVGMPTQATSDPMFERVLDWSETIEPGLPVALLHGKRMVNELWDRLLRRRGTPVGTAETDEFGCRLDEFPLYGNVHEDRGSDTDGGYGSEAPADWFLGRKRGLLAPLVVGTIDQLLFAATRSRHVMLRYAGLAGKVVILDEVHAADVYMSVFLNEVMAWLGQGQVPVIVLSATLAPDQREELVRSYLAGSRSDPNLRLEQRLAPDRYPSVTAAWADAGEPRIDVRTSTPWRSSLAVAVEVLGEDPEAPVDRLVDALETGLAEGGCALVIQNTVDRAREAFEALESLFPGEVRLLHGRFSAADRADKTAEVLTALGPDANQRPHRTIVVATQLAEQSFDIDADLLVSDLAPVDLLLQRAGRLHRHTRPRPAPLRRPRLLVTGCDLKPNQVPWLPGGSRAIYGSYYLIATAAEVQRAVASDGWSIPADVPGLVAAVYGDAPEVPASWAAALSEARSEHEAEQRRRKAEAGQHVIATADQLAKQHIQGLHDNTAPRSEEHVRVRDGESGSEVLFVHRDGAGYRALDGRTWLGVNGEAVQSSHDVLVSTLGGTVRLPAHQPRLSEEIEELPSLPEWHDHSWLKHTHVACLESCSYDLPSFRLHYDRRLGLRWELKS